MTNNNEGFTQLQSKKTSKQKSHIHFRWS